jgi:hypothetical protein
MDRRNARGAGAAEARGLVLLWLAFVALNTLMLLLAALAVAQPGGLPGG